MSSGSRAKVVNSISSIRGCKCRSVLNSSPLGDDRRHPVWAWRGFSRVSNKTCSSSQRTMDIPPAQHANISVHSHELHEEVERLRLSWQIHVAAIDDLKRVNLTYQSEIQCKDQELQLYYKHINRLIHNLNNTNFALTHTRRGIVESKHVTNESLRLMEEYKRRCEILAEQLRQSESQKAEQEKVMRAMYEDMEKARGYIDGEF